MVRRIANQVHKQAARLVKGGYLQSEPIWYKAVLDFPPLPLPPRAPPARTGFDAPELNASTSKQLKPTRPKALPIIYIEDEIRRQFFRDHPFEAFRYRTLSEKETVENEHLVRGSVWTRLSQRGQNPSAEDAVNFAVNLHVHHQKPLSEAYESAVKQFRALRFRHHVATSVAVDEAEAYGAEFDLLEVEKQYLKEEENLSSWDSKDQLDGNTLRARKRWRSIIESPRGEKDWTRGQEYVRLWKEGIRPSTVLGPTVQLSLNADVEIHPAEPIKSPDFMDLAKIIPQKASV